MVLTNKIKEDIQWYNTFECNKEKVIEDLTLIAEFDPSCKELIEDKIKDIEKNGKNYQFECATKDCRYE